MLRTISIAALLILCAAASTGTLLYLAYGLSDKPPRHVAVEGLADSTVVTSHKNGSASIRARDRGDAYTALGYLHAVEHGWTMTLWQRTARGQLSAWLGKGLLPLDRLARRLGFAALAEEAYGSLPDEEKSVLDAYARGVNTAFLESGGARRSEFSILGTAPDRWEPWYALTIERLIAWLATSPPPPDSLRGAPETVRTFYESDNLLREWLHLHEFESSMAWTLQDSSGTHLVQRHVFGSSALPVFQEVELFYPGIDPIAGATLIGTPFMPAGRSGAHAWAVLLSSSAHLSHAMRDTMAVTYMYEKLESADGQEYVVKFPRVSGEIFFEADDHDQLSNASDSLAADTLAAMVRFDSTGTLVSSMAAGWVLEWSGLLPESDASAWLGMPDQSGSPFRIHDGDGLSMSRDGSDRVLGSPLFAVQHGRGVAVGNSSWARYAADRLDSLDTEDQSRIDPPSTLSDVRSTWAAALAPSMIDAAVSVPDQPSLVTEALAYLRNWDYTYERASIAASIFDAWARAYRDSLGHLPEGAVPDSAIGLNLVRYEMLAHSVSELAKRFGEDPSQWRWEEIHSRRYGFPVWSADSLIEVDAGRLSRTRYAPIIVPGAGHLSTLSYGPSNIHPELDAPARWEAWMSTASWESFHFRTRRFPANRFFGRYLISDRIPEAADIAMPTATKYTTTLVPE